MNAPADLLRFTTAGSVDDGKSTLIGRLLYDSRSILEDQLAAIARTTRQRGTAMVNEAGLDLALLTDGLTAEREQGITIDVAYRYFATARRRYIIADTPGHEQYTRNMVTGASTADLAIVLVDARHGVLAQSRRHAMIAALLGIPNLVVAVNKMDLVGYAEDAFRQVRDQFASFLSRLEIANVRFLPMSALLGDMVTERGANLPWYFGDTLLEILETAPTGRTGAAPLRFPVQLVSRPQTPELPDFRGYMGRIESGEVAVGERVSVFPSGRSTHVREIVTLDGALVRARAPQSVTLLLAEDLDVSRGSLITHPEHPPRTTSRFRAQLCWMDDEALHPGRTYQLKHAARLVRTRIVRIEHRVDVGSGGLEPAPSTLVLNDLAEVVIETQKPICCDAYRDNRSTGGFILIDEITNRTVAAGMIAPE